jgi:hypothetical protein
MMGSLTEVGLQVTILSTQQVRKARNHEKHRDHLKFNCMAMDPIEKRLVFRGPVIELFRQESDSSLV